MELRDVPFQAGYDVSSDGARLAVSRLDKAVHIYELQTGHEQQRIPMDRNPAYLRFDPSGRRLVLYHASFANARVLELESGRSEPAFEAEKIQFSVDGIEMASYLREPAVRQSYYTIRNRTGILEHYWDTSSGDRGEVLDRR